MMLQISGERRMVPLGHDERWFQRDDLVSECRDVVEALARGAGDRARGAPCFADPLHSEHDPDRATESVRSQDAAIAATLHVEHDGGPTAPVASRWGWDGPASAGGRPE